MSAPAAPALPERCRPSRIRFVRLASILGALLFLAVASYILGFNPVQVVRDLPFLRALAHEMVPPNLGIFAERPAVLTSVGETVAMAFLGTLFGGMLSVGLALLAARNTTPHPIFAPLTRALLGIERATPNFIVLLILLIAVGFGPFAAMISLAIGSIGMFGKLFAEAIEAVDPAPVESLQAVGANRWQLLRFGIFPQCLPAITGNLFYAFDVNMRAAVALGVYGGGGLGFELNLSTSVLRYEDTLALVICIVCLLTALEKVSDLIRRRLLPETNLKAASGKHLNPTAS